MSEEALDELDLLAEFAHLLHESDPAVSRHQDVSETVGSSAFEGVCEAGDEEVHPGPQLSSEHPDLESGASVLGFPSHEQAHLQAHGEAAAHVVGAPEDSRVHDLEFDDKLHDGHVDDDSLHDHHPLHVGDELLLRDLPLLLVDSPFLRADLCLFALEREEGFVPL